MFNQKRDLINTVIIQIIIIILLLVGAPHNLYSLVIGGLLSLVNYTLLWTLWSFVFNKKNVALIIAIVVIKYSILILVLLKISKIPWIDSAMLAMGILTNFLAIFVYGLIRKHLIK